MLPRHFNSTSFSRFDALPFIAVLYTARPIHRSPTARSRCICRPNLPEESAGEAKPPLIRKKLKEHPPSSDRGSEAQKVRQSRSPLAHFPFGFCAFNILSDEGGW